MGYDCLCQALCGSNFGRIWTRLYWLAVDHRLCDVARIMTDKMRKKFSSVTEMRSSWLIFQFVFEFYDVPTHYHSTIYKKGGARDPGRSFQEAPRLHTGIAKNLDRLNNRIQGQTNGEFCKPSFFLVAQRIMLTRLANRDRQLKSHTVC